MNTGPLSKQWPDSRHFFAPAVCFLGILFLCGALRLGDFTSTWDVRKMRRASGDLELRELGLAQITTADYTPAPPKMWRTPAMPVDRFSCR